MMTCYGCYVRQPHDMLGQKNHFTAGLAVWHHCAQKQDVSYMWSKSATMIMDLLDVFRPNTVKKYKMCLFECGLIDQLATVPHDLMLLETLCYWRPYVLRDLCSWRPYVLGDLVFLPTSCRPGVVGDLVFLEAFCSWSPLVF